MAREIERKFLVKNKNWKKGEGILYRQGYLNLDKERTVRVRVAGQKGFLTVKGPTQGATRLEYEYEIPVADAGEMLDQLCEKPLIEKFRTLVTVKQTQFEVDEFLGENRGLIVAEVELEDEEQVYDRPDWLGKEVTDDPRYYNANLIRFPFSAW